MKKPAVIISKVDLNSAMPKKSPNEEIIELLTRIAEALERK